MDNIKDKLERIGALVDGWANRGKAGFGGDGSGAGGSGTDADALERDLALELLREIYSELKFGMHGRAVAGVVGAAEVERIAGIAGNNASATKERVAALTAGKEPIAVSERTGTAGKEPATDLLDEAGLTGEDCQMPEVVADVSDVSTFAAEPIREPAHGPVPESEPLPETESFPEPEPEPLPETTPEHATEPVDEQEQEQEQEQEPGQESGSEPEPLPAPEPAPEKEDVPVRSRRVDPEVIRSLYGDAVGRRSDAKSGDAKSAAGRNVDDEQNHFAPMGHEDAKNASAAFREKSDGAPSVAKEKPDNVPAEDEKQGHRMTVPAASKEETVIAPTAFKERPGDMTADRNNAPKEKLGDVMNAGRQTLGESLRSGEKDMASKIAAAERRDLKRSIGINDKFLMIRDMFDGDAASFSRTIDYLDTFTDLDEAIIYIHDTFDWSADSDGVKLLVDLLERKLG